MSEPAEGKYRFNTKDHVPAGAQDWASDEGQQKFRFDTSQGRGQQPNFVTGQNLQGTDSGWNTAFLRKFNDDYNRAIDEGNALDYFRQKRDGIALWDDQEKGIRFGDVFAGGRKVENLYDAYGAEFADNVMGQLVDTGSGTVDQARVANSEQAAARRAAGDSDDYRYFLSQKEFEDAVDQKKDGWDQGVADVLTVLGGAAGGAVTFGAGGAGIGSIIPGIGTLAGAAAGAIGGALSGGWGAWMNRDELQDMAARGEAQAELAAKEGTGAGGVFTKLRQYGGLAGQLMNPLGNIVHGAADAEYGTQGDRQSGFYSVDAEGELNRSKLYSGLDIGAGFVTAASQFANPVGVAAFTGQMWAQIGGSVGEFAFTGGQTFDDARGAYDEIFLEEDGSMSLGSFGQGMAGLGAIGIDAVQLLGARGIASGAAQAGGINNKGLWGILSGTRTSRTNAKGITRETQMGMTFTKDAKGNITKVRLSPTMLAPSEMVQYGHARIAAMFLRGGQQRGPVSADELYNAVQSIQRSGRTSVSALINGFGEGFEEAAQAILEPISHGYNSFEDPMEIARAFAYGSAMGAGMTLGGRIMSGSPAEREMNAAKKLAEASGEEVPSNWKEMSRQDRHTWFMERQQYGKVLEAEAENVVKQLLRQTLTSNVMAEEQSRAVEREATSAAKSANPGTDRSYVASQASSGVADHQVSYSLNTLVRDFEGKIDGHRIIIDNQTDQGNQQNADLVRRVDREARRVLQVLRARQQEFYRAATTDARRAAIVREINRNFESMWDLTDHQGDQSRLDAAMAVMMLIQRDPSDNAGSVHGMMPLLSLEESMPVEAGSEKGMGDNRRTTSLAVAQAQGLDFDGDMTKALARMMLDANVFRSLRTSTNLITPSAQGELVTQDDGTQVYETDLSGAVNVMTTPLEETIIEIVADTIRTAPTNSAAQRAVNTFTDNLKRELQVRYGNQMGGAEGFHRDIDDFIFALRGGDTGAKGALLDAMISKYMSDVQRISEKDFTSPILDMNTLIRQHMWNFQKQLSQATHDERKDSFQTTAQEVQQYKRFAVVDATSNLGRFVAERAVTWTQQVVNAARANELFRMLQALNYSNVRSPEDQVIEGDETAQRVMARMYARLNSGQFGTKLEELDLQGRIEANVLNKLRLMAESLHGDDVGIGQMDMTHNMLVLAGMQVQGRDQDGNPTRHNVSVIQQLLQDEVAAERRRTQGQATSTELAKFARFENASTASAMMYVTAGMSAVSVLGQDADVFGAGRTIGSIVAEYINQDEYHRQITSQLLRSHATYNNQSRRNLPYDRDAAKGKTNYHVFVDALLEHGNAEFTYDATKDASQIHDLNNLAMGGRVGQSSARFSVAFREGIEKMHQGLDDGTISKVNRHDRDQLIAALDENQDWFRSYLRILTNRPLITSISRENGHYASWIIDALMAPTSAEAEAIFWRGLRLEEYNSLGALDEADKTDDRIMELFHRVASMKSYSIRKKFESQLFGMKDVNVFLAWVNDPANGIRGNEAPFTAWHTDLAEVDPSYTEGKLSASLPSAQRREAISEFQEASERFSETIQFRRTVEAEDNEMVLKLERGLKNPNVEDSKLVEALRQRIRFAARFKPALGPRAFHWAVAGNLRVILNATDKGKASSHVAPIGALDMMNNQAAFGTPEEALLDSLTAVEVDETSPQWLLDARRMVSADGTNINWEGLTPEIFVEMFKEPQNRMLLKQILFPSVYEATADLGVEQRLVIDPSLKALLSRGQYQKMVFGNSPQAKALNVAILDGMVEDHEVMKYVSALTTVRTAALDQVVQTDEAASELTRKATMDFIEIIRAASPFANMSTNGDSRYEVTYTDSSGNEVTKVPDTVMEWMAEKLLMEMRADRVTKTSRVEKHMLDQARLDIDLDLIAQIDNLRLQNDPALNSQIQYLEDLRDVLNDVGRDRLAQMFNRYGLPTVGDKKIQDRDWEVTSARARRDLFDYVLLNGDLLAGATWTPSIRKAHEASVRNDLDYEGLPRLTRKEWGELSRAVMGHVMKKDAEAAGSTTSMMVVPGNKWDDLKLWDPNHSWVIRDLLDPKSPMVAAMNDLRREHSLDNVFVANEEVTMALLRERFIGKKKDNSLGPWTEALAQNIQQSVERIDASGVVGGISSGGNIPNNEAAVDIATARTFEDPTDEMLSAVTIPVSSLENPHGAMSVTHPSGQSKTHNIRQLDGRFVKSVRLRLNRPGITYAEDVTASSNVHLRNATTWFTRGGGLDYKFVNRRNLLAAAEGWFENQRTPEDVRAEYVYDIEFFHPDDITPELANNLYMEGVVAEGDTDYFSLKAVWDLSAGGIDQTASTWALQSTKKKHSALRKIRHVPKDQVDNEVVGWEVDYGHMLHRLTEMVLSKGALGGKESVNPNYYNAIRKTLMMRHHVRVSNPDGSLNKLLSSEEVLQLQASGQDLATAYPGMGVELVRLSGKRLRAMLGDPSDWGNLHVPLSQISANPMNIGPWTGVITQAHRDRLTGLDTQDKSRTLFDGRRRGFGRLSELTNFDYLSPTEDGGNTLGLALEHLDQLESDIHADRTRHVSNELRQDAMSRAFDHLGEITEDSNIPNLMSRLGFPQVPLSTSTREDLQRKFAEGEKALWDSVDQRMWHTLHFATGPKGTYVNRFGEISGISGLARRGKDKHLWVAQNDSVNVLLDELKADEWETLRSALDILMGYGAKIHLVSDAPRGGLYELARRYLEDHGFEKIRGLRWAYQRKTSMDVPRALRASWEQLVERGSVVIADKVPVYQSMIFGKDENAGAVLNPGFRRRAFRKRTPVPIHSSEYERMTPRNANRVRQQIMDARDDLIKLAVQNDSKLKDLRKRKDNSEARHREQVVRKEITRALDKYIAYTDRPQSPHQYEAGYNIEIGDLIPMVGKNGRIKLIRYGFAPPSRSDWKKMHDNGKFILYTNDLDSSLTTIPGTVQAVVDNGQAGMAIEVLATLQDFGGKLVFEGTGFKVTLNPSEVKFVDLMDGIPMEIGIGRPDSLSKNNLEGNVDNFQTAFTYLGNTFHDELAETLFGKQPGEVSRDEILSRLRQIQAMPGFPRFDIRTTDSFMRSPALSSELQAVLTSYGNQLNSPQGREMVAAVGRQQDTPAWELTKYILTYLTYSDASPEDIFDSPGVAAPHAGEKDRYTWKPPALFTHALDRVPLGTPLRRHLFNKLNARLNGNGWRLRESWILENLNENSSMDSEGILQFIAMDSAATNPVTSTDSSRQIASQQAARVFGSTLGARIEVEKDLDVIKRLADNTKRIQVTDVPSLYQLMGSRRSKPSMTENDLTPGEVGYILGVREDVMASRQPLTHRDWDDAEIKKHEAAKDALASKYGFTFQGTDIFDYWIRIHSGHPTLTKRQIKKMTAAEVDQALNEIGEPTYIHAAEALSKIEENLEAGRLPVSGSFAPLIHLSDLAALHRASTTGGGRFRLRTTTDSSNKETTENWDDWVRIALATGSAKNQPVHRAMLRTMDGMLHTYADAGVTFTGYPVSFSEAVSAALKDKNLSDLVSIMPERAEALRFEEYSLTQTPTDLSTGVPQPIAFSGKELRSSMAERFRRSTTRNLTETGSPHPVGHTVTDLIRDGDRFIERANQTNAVFRVAMNLRAGMALLNPLLWASSFVETGAKTILDSTTRLVQGDAGSLGLLGSAIDASIKGATGGKVKLAQRSFSEQRDMETFYRDMGSHSNFMAMLYNEFKMDHHAGAHGLERMTEKLAQFAGKMQDGRYGMVGKFEAKQYFESVNDNIRVLNEMGYTNLTYEQVMRESRSNPLWVSQHHPAIHQMAMNRILNLKNIKATVPSLQWRRFIDPMTTSPRFGVSLVGTLARMQFMFANYGFNTAINIFGLQGLDAFMAIHMHGKQRSSVSRGLMKGLAAVTGHAYTLDKAEDVLDYSEAIENIDLSHAFLKSGITMTGLFAAGLASGSLLGLAGEDEEDRRRRRAARFQGAALLLDPMDIANDFRNTDAIYLDNVPLLNSLFKVVADDEDGAGSKSMAHMNFIMKQVLSPVLGMERFLNSGDPLDIVDGFMDAVGSMPLINSMRWQESVEVFDELMNMAGESDAVGGTEALPKTTRYMFEAIAWLDRMLLENSFANMLYVGFDKYDRDNYAKVLRDESGGVARDINGNPLPTTELTKFVDPNTGMTRMGYAKHDIKDAMLRNLAENRMGIGLISQLVTLGKNDIWRYNQKVKSYDFDGTELTADAMEQIIGPVEVTLEQADGVVRAMWKGGADPAELNLEGFYMTYEMREQLQLNLKEEIAAALVEAGMDEDQVKYHVNSVWKGSNNPGVPSLEDIVYSKGDYANTIPYSASTEYLQLNTTYVPGPDGRYWATGISRNVLENWFGFRPLQGYILPQDSGLDSDSRMNVVDPVTGMNLGMRAVERLGEGVVGRQDLLGEDGTGTSNSAGFDDDDDSTGSKKYGSGWRNFGRRSGGGGGGGSFTRLYAPQDNYVPYGNTIANLSASNPLLRRPTIRRERTDSQKGRLKPWQ